ncbi:MAG: transglutaminase-like cysteine peptidase [Alphaproteobacteria bacterium]|nr:transglutaminase-like cysteine peptidase [Alphaproteobacteria bacterium]
MTQISTTGGLMTSLKKYLNRNRFGEVLVHRGLLSAAQLHEALSLQKVQKLALGEILVRQGVISRWDLRTTLALQTSIRMIAAFVTITASLMAYAPRDSYAESIKDIPNSITLASVTVPQSEIVVQSNLFGTAERRSTDLSSFTKWSDMFDRFNREVSRESSAKVIQKWRSDLVELQGKPLVEMANSVNNLMNKVKYIGDNRNWGKSDYWETPVEFLTRGGDCEDFAIAKYVSLRALGVPESQLRIAVVKDIQKGIPHAILIVYTEEGPMVLDNQIKAMTRASMISHYKPIFSINNSSWWVHTDQAVGVTQIATASR